MNEDNRRQIAEQVRAYHLPRFKELPDVGLYLEQVVCYVNRFLPSKVTASMVSNYVKQKTIPGPNKKVYGRETIAYLIFVSFVKAVVSMEDIRLLMDIQKDSYELGVAYDYFCDELENLLQFVSGVKTAPDFVGHEETAQKQLLRTALFSITYKMYLDACIALARLPEEP